MAEGDSGILSVASLLGGMVSDRGAKVRRWSLARDCSVYTYALRGLALRRWLDAATSGRLDLIAAVVVPLPPRVYAVGHMLVGMLPLSSVGWRCGHWKGVSSVYTVVDTKLVGLFDQVRKGALSEGVGEGHAGWEVDVEQILILDCGS